MTRCPGTVGDHWGMSEQYQPIRNQPLLTLSDPAAHLLNRFDVGNLTQLTSSPR